MLTEFKIEQLLQELSFSASRSSGPGGQNVNKVNSKIELRFSIIDSTVLNENEKTIILTKLATKLTAQSELIITAQTSRSQLKNKEEAIHKFIALIEKALLPVKLRRASKPTLASKRKRLETKKQISTIKNLRKKPEL
jgi:ribosome-associated protein